MVPIHLLIHALGKTVSAKVTRFGLNRTTCTHCRESYVYQVRRTAEVSAYAFLFLGVAAKQANATAKATARADKKVAAAIDPVPCPACGHLQPDMLATIRKKLLLQFLVLTTLAALLLGAAWFVILEGVAPAFAPALQITTGATIALLLLVAAALFLRDPNAAAHRHTRAALGEKCRALPAKEFDALLHAAPPPDA